MHYKTLVDLNSTVLKPVIKEVSESRQSAGLFGFGLRPDKTTFIIHGTDGGHTVQSLQENLSKLTGTEISDVISLPRRTRTRDALITAAGETIESMIYIDHNARPTFHVGVLVGQLTHRNTETDNLVFHAQIREKYWRYSLDVTGFVSDCNCPSCDATNAVATRILEGIVKNPTTSKPLAYEL